VQKAAFGIVISSHLHIHMSWLILQLAAVIPERTKHIKRQQQRADLQHQWHRVWLVGKMISTNPCLLLHSNQ
jgi:hypothetical protein